MNYSEITKMINGIKSVSSPIGSMMALLISISFSFAFEEGDLVITEYFVKSNGAIPDYVEIYNTTDVDINLQNWTIGVGVADLNYHTITESFVIPKHEYVFFSGEEGYFTGQNNGENVLYLPMYDLRLVSPCSDPDIYDEDDCLDAGETWAEDTDFDEDFYADTEGVTKLVISNGYWLPFLIINSQGIFEIQDPSGNFIDGFFFNEGTGCPDFGSGSGNRGHSVELKLDPNIDTVEDDNDDCVNWEISNQTPGFMLNEHPDVEWFGGDGTQEWGSPGISNHTPINVAINEGGEFSYTISWESSHSTSDLGITQFNIYRDDDLISQVDASQNSYQNDGLSEGELYYFQVSALNTDESDRSDSLAVSLPDAFAGVDQEVNIEPGSTTIDVTLSGSFSNPEGDETTYEWTFEGNVISTELTTIQTLEMGEYSYTFKVTDSHGGFSTDDVQITVNSPLIAEIAYPMVFTDAPHDGDPGGNGLVTFDGTGSSASEGILITQWLWYELLDSGEEEFIITGEYIEDHTIEVGFHNIILEVQDDQIPPLVARDTADVTISEPNDPPVADAGEPQTIIIPHDGVNGVTPTYDEDCEVHLDEEDCITGEDSEFCIWENDECVTDPFIYLPSFTVNGILSSDPEDDEIISYLWSLNDSTLGDTLAYTGTLPDAGIYDIELTVHDSYNSTDVDTVIITVNEEPNIAPNAVVEADTIYAEVSTDGIPGGTVQVILNNHADESHGYSNDPDGDNITLRWGIDSDKNGVWEYGEPFTDDNCNGIHDDDEEFIDEDSNDEFTVYEPSTSNFQNLEADEPYVDVNYNGQMDGEPFEDCGADGLCDEVEPGYDEITNPDPNGDNYHPNENPEGTEGNNLYETGEVFQDLDSDGSFDGGEPYNDVNNNDQWDDGIYEFILTVLDPYCTTDTAPMNVLVWEDNSPPEIIEPLEDQEVMENTTVTLTGNAYDEDNPDDLEYFWFTDNELVDLSDPTEMITEFVSPNLETNEPLNIEFIFEISDPFNETDRDTLQVTVLNSNGTPNIINPLPDYTILEDASDTTIFITDVFSDPDDDEMTFALDNTNEEIIQATLTDTTIQLQYIENQFGIAQIILTADDGITRESSSDTMSVTISPVNDPPEITSTAPDSATEDIEYTYQVFWDDPDDTEFVFTLFDVPEGMVVTETGLISWTPENGVINSDVVTLQLEDSGGSEGVIQNDFEEFIINVTPVNDSPMIISTAPDSAYEDIEYIYEIDVADPDDDEFTFELFNAPENMQIDSSGVITWTPVEGELTSGLVTVRVSDGGEDNAAPDTEDFEVFVNAINDPPVILSVEEPVTLFEDISQTIEATIFEIEDPDNDYPEDFTVVINDGENYSFSGDTLISNPDYFGDLVVNLVIFDGLDSSDEYSLNVVVESINDPPEFTINQDTVEVNEDFSSASAIFITQIPQPDNESEEVITYTLEPSSVDFADIFMDNDELMISFFSVQDSFGVQDINIKASDNGGIENNGIDTSIVEFTLIVNGVNDLPSFELSENDVEYDEDFPEIQTITIVDYYDVENDTPVFYLTPESVTWAAVIIDSILGDVSISAIPDSSGEMDFTVTAIDDPISGEGVEAYFSLLVNPVNDSPYFTLDSSYVQIEDNFDTLSITVEEFHEPDNDEVTFTISPEEVTWADISIDPETGKVSVISVSDSSGTQIFQVSCDDGQGESNSIFTQEFTLFVRDQNDPPLFELNMEEIILQEDFTESDTIIVTPLQVPPNETWQTVQYSIIPDETNFIGINIDPETGKTFFEVISDSSGTQIFQIKAQDNGDTLYFGTDTALVSISVTVEAVNDSIILLQELEDLVLDEDSDQLVIELENYFSDIENSVEELELSYEVDTYHIPDTNLVTIVKSGEDLQLSLIPNANDTADVTIILTDLGDNPDEVYGDLTLISKSATFTLLVNQVVDQDSVTDVSIHEPIPEDTTDYHFFISYQNFDADINLNSDPVEATTLGIGETSVHMMDIELVDPLTQEWTIGSLLEDWNGIDSIAIIASIGLDVPDTTFWIVEVSQVNDPPVIQSANFIGGLESIPEDSILIQFEVQFDDIDSDTNLNVDPIDLSLLEWDFQTPVTSTGQHFFASYDNNSGTFWLDSLLLNWNGPDSLQIIVTDSGFLSDTFYFQIFVDQVIDQPVINIPYFEDGSKSIPEDTTFVSFIIEYENTDADPSLNFIPIGIDTIFVEPDHDIFYGISFVEENTDFDSLSQTWNINSLLNNWNGIDSLKIKIQNLEGLQDSTYFPVYVYQINDIPEEFALDVEIESYGIDSTSYYDLSMDFPAEESILNYRLPFSADTPVTEQIPSELLLKWDRTQDFDTDSTLNNDMKFVLYYRIELTTDNSDSIFIIGDSIPDFIFSDGFACDSLLGEVLVSDSNFSCTNYEFLTDPQFAFYSIDLTESFSTYPDSVLYEEADLENKVPLEINGLTKYTWRVIAKNYETDSRGNDLEQLQSADENPFYIDITLPSAEFFIMQNEMFSEYFDLYIFPSDSIYNFPELNQPITILLDPLTPRLDYSPAYLSEGIYHLSSNFDSTGILTMEFQGRDRVQNFGSSVDSATYQIASPDAFNRISSPGGLAEITISQGALSTETGIVIMEFPLEDYNRSSEQQISSTVYFSPANLEFETNAVISFLVDNEISTIADPWQIQIYKKVSDEWNPVTTKYENHIAISEISSLGYYAVFYNPEAEYGDVVILPENFDLKPAFPNPFNPVTHISFDIPVDSKIDISIFDIKGRYVTSLTSDWYQAGEHTLMWDAEMESSGVYLIQMKAGNYSKTNKVVLLK